MDETTNTLHAVLARGIEGWVCTEDDCGYTQDWAHDFMTTEAARTPFWQRAEVLAELAVPPSSASVAPQPEET